MANQSGQDSVLIQAGCRPAARGTYFEEGPDDRVGHPPAQTPMRAELLPIPQDHVLLTRIVLQPRLQVQDIRNALEAREL